jgi:peroxiredoxin Q/BCP
MRLRPGDTAPDFETIDHAGRKVRLSDYRGKKNVVLYFYPKDFTRVCTAETCGFRDMYNELRDANVEVFGVSLDTRESHRQFAEKHQIPFALLTDPTKALTRQYGALSTVRSLLGLAKRLTYVIDKQGRIAGAYEGELSAKVHLDGVRGCLWKLKTLAG